MIKKFLALTLCVLGFGCFTSGLIACKSDNSSGEGNNYTFESAYEQATALGYAGTLEEFIIQISGKDGVDGQDGKDGEDGEDGQDGADGKDGADGQDGKDGLDGKDGIGIKNVFINADGDLIVELTDGSVKNAGKVRHEEIQSPELSAGTEGLFFNATIGKGGIEGYAVSLGIADDEKIVIPSRFNGKPIVTINSNAFYGNKTITDIKIPETVTAIGNNAFADCAVLQNISLPESVTAIGEAAFYNCKALKNIKIPDGVTRINERTFMHCEELSSVKIGNKVEVIRDEAFQYCHKLVRLDLPDSVEMLTGDPFYGCGLEVLNIGSGLTGDLPLFGCEELQYITVSDKNAGYSSYEGVLYNKNKTSFKHIPIALTGTLTVPESITEIGEGCFGGLRNLTDIKLHNKITTIGKAAFNYCRSLKKIVIPNGVTSIGERAFASCTSLEEAVIPDSVTSIGERTFEFCGSLEKMTLPFVGAGENAYREKAQTIFGYFFSKGKPENESLFELTEQGYEGSFKTKRYIPKSIRSVTVTGGTLSEEAFGNCKYITDIDVTGVEYLENTFGSRGLFYGCGSIKNIRLPFVGMGDGKKEQASATTVFGSIFGNESCQYDGSVEIKQNYDGFSNYRSYYIPADLKKVYVQGGNLLPGAFYGCNMLTQVTLGNSVKYAGNIIYYNLTAFNNCTALEKIEVVEDNENICVVTGVIYNKEQTEILFINPNVKGQVIIPDGITTISDRDFRDMPGITSVVLGSGIENIEWNAFEGCDNLNDVFYKGTENEWKLIHLYGNEKFENPFYYSEAEPQQEGRYWHYVDGVAVKW